MIILSKKKKLLLHTNNCRNKFPEILIHIPTKNVGGVFSVTVIVAENGIDDQSSNPGRGSLCLNFCANFLRKGTKPSLLLPAAN